MTDQQMQAVKARDLRANETASLSPPEGNSVGAAFKAATSTVISVMWHVRKMKGISLDLDRIFQSIKKWTTVLLFSVVEDRLEIISESDDSDSEPNEENCCSYSTEQDIHV